MKDSMKDNFVYDGYAALAERTIKRLWILCILLVVLLVGTNGAWIWYESQFTDESTETTTVTQELDSDGGGDAIINDGVHINGESETNSQKN